jgi:hypothetical protein
MTDLYILEEPESSWGDYGDILLHGMASWRPEGAPLVLERTGPFMPSLTMPGFVVVVRDQLRSRLEDAWPAAVTFRPVIKKRIVKLDWHLWDRGAPEPKRYPREGEPENYVLGRKHNPGAAESLGPVWELVIPVVPGLQLEGGRVVRAKYQGQLVCRPVHDGGFIFVAPTLRQWLEAEVPECVRFRPAEFADAA